MWSAEALKRAAGGPVVDWSALPSLNRTINRRITGDEDTDWLAWIRDFAPGGFGLGLSIGCGTGALERAALREGLCARMHGVDVAAGALEVAGRLAGALPLEYRQVDLETGNLEAGRYDIIFSDAALHHICNLESCVAGLHSALKEGGLLALSEYAGPSRFQWTPAQLRLVSDLFSLLPWSRRYNHKIQGTMPRLLRPEICAMVAADPSEAVRSSELLGVVERFFEALDRRPFGGTLLNPLLAGIAENFDESDESDLAFLRLAGRLEELLVGEEALPSDFVVGVYRRRDDPDIPEGSDLERSAVVRRQERRIEDILHRLAALERSNEETLEEIEKTTREAGELGAEVTRIQSLNAGLKKGLFFSAARGLTGRAAAEPGSAGPGRGAGRDAGRRPRVEAPLVPVSLHEEYACMTPEARAVRRYVDGLAGSGDVLWLLWSADVAGVPGARALFVGTDPAPAGPAVRAGLCSAVDIAMAPLAGGGFHVESTGGVPAAQAGPYEIVVLDLDAPASGPGSIGEAAAAVADGGVLIVLSAGRTPTAVQRENARRLLGALPEFAGEPIPAGGPPKDPGADVLELEDGLQKGFELEAARGFGAATGHAACRLALRQGASDMDAALARLLVYAEGVLVCEGLLAAALEVRIFRKGGGTAGRSEPVGDIMLLQAAEIERLLRKVREATERGELLKKDLCARMETLEMAARDLEVLRMELDALESRGIARYIGLFRVFAARHGREKGT